MDAGHRGRHALGAVLLVAALWLMHPVAAAHAQRGFAQGLVRMWDPALSRGLADDARLYRVLNNVPAARNVAVFRYRLPNGEERTLAIDSAPFSPGGGKRLGEGHSEERLDHILDAWGIDSDWVVEIYSELEPCAQRGHFCANLIQNKFKKLEGLHWSLDYPYDESSEEASQRAKSIRRQSVNTLRENVRDLRQANSLPGGRGIARGKNPFGPGRGRLPVLTPHFTPRMPGGIDLTTLQLRYVADAGKGGLRYAFRGTPATAAADPAAGQATVGEASDALFTWLALPPQTFWVNLLPNEPDRIIDPNLARTDAGRVMLEADLRLKKETVGLINPDTPLGDRFWDEIEKLYGARAPQACVSFRVWIVPQPATVHEDGDSVYILDAPLTVNTQSMQIQDPATGNAGCPQESPAVEAKKEELLRTLILPTVSNSVNTAPEFAALRRVYVSRVAAEWFRQRSAKQRTPVSDIVNSGNVDRWDMTTPWSPMDVFNQYLRSYRNGEWTAKREVRVGDRVYEKTMVYGGVDFSQTPERPVTTSEFKARWPKLATRVKRAEHAPTSGDGEVWFGGGDPRDAIGSVTLRLRTAHRRVTAGDRVSYRVRVSNPASAAVRDVRVCDRLPRGLAFVRASRRARVQAGWHCVEIARIAGHRSATIRLTARALNGAHGRAVNEVTASVRDSVQGARASHTLRIVRAAQSGRPGGVTG